ncbi:MAG TPA: DedA family protein [Solirubrobacteraceae bacterium]|jgi:membrane protein DedA with SNARE-associated domain
MLALAALIGLSNSLGYLLPALIGLESMGVPSPGETALVAAAVLASQGKLNIELVILIGIVSAIVGDNLGYFLGRRFGRDVLVARGPFHRRRQMAIEAGEKFFDKHGGKAVFLARWVALVRVAAAWLAGINHMPFKEFFFWNALGGITWGITFGLVGYFVGERGAHLLSEIGLIGAAVLVVMAIGGVIWFKRRERQATARDAERD